MVLPLNFTVGMIWDFNNIWIKSEVDRNELCERIKETTRE